MSKFCTSFIVIVTEHSAHINFNIPDYRYAAVTQQVAEAHNFS